jgi:predicted glycosyltransferase
MTPPRTLLYYCQSLVGVGHLTASLRIIEALLPHGVQVDLLYGGLDAALPQGRPGLRALRLPTLLHDEDSGEVFAPDTPGADVAAVWRERAQAIGAFLRPRYDGVVIEFWPFGRRRFKDEIRALLRSVQEGSGPVPVFTSVREVLVPRPPEHEQRVVASVRKHIHTVFVRGDAQVIRLDETFSRAGEIAAQLVHTGYLADNAAPALPREQRVPRVLVSQGGGDVGRELLRAALGAAAHLPQLQFVLVGGSRTPAQELQALREQARSANVQVLPFLDDFVPRLRESALSINMGGDNTLLEVLAARTPGLAYPYQDNPEQGIRIRKFAQRGLLHEIGPDDLQPERLAARIGHALAVPYPAHRVAMDGARVTSERIRAVLDAAA